MTAFRVVPVTAKAAQAWVAKTHRHLPRIGMSRFAVGVAINERLVGVAVVTNGPAAWEGTTRMVIARARPTGRRIPRAVAA